MVKILNARKVGKTKPGAVYVGRPSKFGNPFIVGVHAERGECIALFKDKVDKDPTFRQMIREELAGKDLICWCAPAPCHAEILAQVANGIDDDLFS